MSNPEFDWTTILPEDERRKIALFTNVDVRSVISRTSLSVGTAHWRHIASI